MCLCLYKVSFLFSSKVPSVDFRREIGRTFFLCMFGNRIVQKDGLCRR
jgi:hypothetical protein